MYDKKTLELTQELFDELVKDDKWLRDIYHSVKCCDRNGVFICRKTVSYPVEYIVSEDLWKQSEILFGLRKLEMLQGIHKGDLVFISMGCDDQICGDIGNHRIRARFKSNDGKSYFVELLSGGTCDFSIDLDIANEIEQHNKSVRANWDAMPKERQDSYRGTPENQLPDELRYDWSQREYNAKGVEKKRINYPYTWAGVLAFVNETYGCNYTSARRLPLGYFNDGDIVCEC